VNVPNLYLRLARAVATGFAVERTRDRIDGSSSLLCLG
jgi:hypothetical protein